MLKEDALVICKKLFDQKPTRSQDLGGNSRDSVRIYFEDHSIIATRRKSTKRAELESIVLRELNLAEGPVPKILHYDDNWLLQEDLGDVRLSMALAKANKPAGIDLLTKCLEGLADIHRIGMERQLDRYAPKIGQKVGWLKKFITIPENLGQQIEIPAPTLDKSKIIAVFQMIDPVFLKWDARPGNVMVTNKGASKWIDWEHCGVRNALDDAAWLLCDEYTPDWPDIESELLTKAISEMTNNKDQKEALTYLAIFGTLHMCYRLSLIFAKKSDGPWWHPDECLINDRVGVFPIAAKRTCNRAMRWAAKDKLTAPLSPWLEKISLQMI